MSEPTPARRHRLRRTLAAALLAGTTLAGFSAAPVLNAFAQSNAQNNAGQGNANQTVPPIQAPGPSTQGQAPVNQGQAMRTEVPNFVGLVKQVRPAVVTVTNYLKAGATMSEEEGGSGGEHGGTQPQLPFPFNQFPFNQMPFGGQQPHARAVEARGSGFIINPNGLIVTNNHVVKDAKRLEVTMANGQKFAATVVGTDPRTDIAVIRIHANGPLPYLQLGDSRAVEPGEWVIAIGNPFGLSETVTAGIVSAVGRSIGAGPYDRFIQVDAPINRGNSGGPLITQDGKVVGMNTAILSPSGGSVGIGFAIPSDLIQQIASDLERSGHVTRGYLGVEAQSVSEQMAKALSLPNASGALVASVQPDTPAARAGLQPGDVIEQVNGKNIKDPSALAMAISGIQPGNEAHLQVLRDGQQQQISVNVAQLPTEEQTAANQRGSGQQQQEEQGKLGVALGPVSPDLASQLDLPDGTRGAVVTKVQPGSPAESAGLQTGDVIVGVGTHKVGSPSEASRAIRNAVQKDRGALALRIIRNGQPAFVAVNLSNHDQSEKG